MNFEDICNWVVLISATLFAIKNILTWIGKPFGFFKKKQDEELKENPFITSINHTIVTIIIPINFIPFLY